MCYGKFHRYCNCYYEPNEAFDRYVIEYVGKLPRRIKKHLKKISIRRPLVLDFYYHINKKTHLADYYVCDVWYRYKKATRSYGFKIPLEELET